MAHIPFNDFYNLDNMKLKDSALDSLVSDVRGKYPPGPDLDKITIYFDAAYPAGLLSVIGDESSGFINSGLTQLDLVDTRKLQNCLDIANFPSLSALAITAFETITNKFNDLRDYIYKGCHFDRVYSILCNLYDDVYATVDAFLIDGAQYILDLVNVIDNISTYVSSAISAMSSFCYDTARMLITSGVVTGLASFVETLGCIGEATPVSMYGYRNSDLIKNIEIVNKAINDPASLTSYIQGQINTSITTYGSQVDTAYSNMIIAV